MSSSSSSSGLFRSLLIDENDPCFSLERPELQALFSTMTGGAWVKKYTNSGKPLRRHLYLTPSHDAVVYVSEKKRVEDCTMALSDLDGVYRGQHTSVFFAAKAGRHCTGVPSQHCLSLVSTSGTPRKSLDVEFQTEAEASAWHTGLSALLIAALVSVEDSETRALRRAFSHALKRLPRAAASSTSLEEREESMSSPPPLSLLPLSSIKGLLPNTTLAHQEGRLLELLREEGAHISLPGLLRAFNSLRSEDRCDVAALFHNLLLQQQRTAGASGLTPVTLLNFLHTHQGWDEATLEDATNLCRRWGDSRFGSPHKSSISGRVGAGAELSPSLALAPPLVMTLPSFVAWMTSSFNSALSPITTALGACDMTAPLAHYWIAASHNTYLEGDQLVSASSTAPYLNALAKGCRCVELDVWDGISVGGSGGAGDAGAGVQPSSSSSSSFSHLSSSSSAFEPIVTHGGTLTSRIPFRDVIHALAAHAFLSREEDCYPLILSLELHCSQPQQERVAEILKESFPGRLLTWEYLCEQERERERERRGWSAEEGSALNPSLLSPSTLCGKVLVKTKFKGDLSVALSTPLSPSTRTAFAIASSSGVPLSSSRSGWGGSEGALSTFPPSSATSAAGGGGGEGKGGAGALPHMPISPLSKSLTEVVYLRGVPWRTLLLTPNGVSESEGEGGGAAVSIPLPTLHPSPTLPSSSSSSSSSLAAPPPPPHIIASVKESNLLALMRKSRTLAHLHSVTRSNLVRVYPGTFRVTSSNFNPTPFWCAGVQMTALNYQTNDIPLRIQKAWFQRNGRCGYVLKPLYLRCGSMAAQGGVLTTTTTTATTATSTSTSPSPTPLFSGSTSSATDAAAASAFSAEFETGEGAPPPSHPPPLPPSSATHHHDMRVNPPPPPGDGPRRTRTYSRTERLKDWVRSVERMAPPPSPRSSAAAAAAAAASLEQQSSSNGTGVVVVTGGASPTSPTSPSTTLPFSSLDMEGGVLSALLLPTPDAHAAPTPMTLHVTLLGVTHLPLSREHALVQWTLHIFGHPKDSCRVKVGGKPVLTPSQGECLWLEHSSSAAAAAASSGGGGGGSGGGGEVEGVVEGKARRGGAGVTFQLSHPELATLYLEAHEVGDIGSRPCGYAVLPIPCARRGYRCLNVRSPSGGKIPLCTLFLKLQKAPFPAPPLVK